MYLEFFHKYKKDYNEHSVTGMQSRVAQFTNKPRICQDFAAFVFQIISPHEFSV